MNKNKLAAACVMLTALLVGLYGYATVFVKEPLPDTGSIDSLDALPNPVPNSPTDIPKMTYPQGTRVTGRSVYVSVGGALGCGVVIDKRTVLTINHVVKKQKLVMVDVGKLERKWVPAIVVGKIHAVPEDIVILRITTKDYFPDIDHFKRGAGIPLPMMMATTRGVFSWNPGAVVPGDSGGAVLNIDGELIGLVVGYRIVGKHGVVAVFR